MTRRPAHVALPLGDRPQRGKRGRDVSRQRLEASVNAALRLWWTSRLRGRRFARLVVTARRITQEPVSLGSVQRGEPGRGRAMAYFFAVLHDLVDQDALARNATRSAMYARDGDGVLDLQLRGTCLLAPSVISGRGAMRWGRGRPTHERSDSPKDRLSELVAGYQSVPGTLSGPSPPRCCCRSWSPSPPQIVMRYH